MAKSPKAAESNSNREILIDEFQMESVTIKLVGTTPLVFNSMSAKQSLEGIMVPELGGRREQAQRTGSLKHDPIQEYRDSVYRSRGADAPTRLVVPGPAFKGALLTAALRTPGVTKTEMGQLTWVEGYSIDLYGVPQMMMAVVRQAGMNKTPDVRTRAIVPEWACQVTIRYAVPALRAKTIGSLMHSAGLLCGVGDYRQEKGKGSFGLWRCVQSDDPTHAEIVAAGGREAQDAALESPDFYDADTEQMFRWYTEAVRQLGVEQGHEGFRWPTGTAPSEQEIPEPHVVAHGKRGRTNGKAHA